jgi:hypothetical protein
MRDNVFRVRGIRAIKPQSHRDTERSGLLQRDSVARSRFGGAGLLCRPVERG